ncbi:hypothetical protein COCMIDRAFT_91714 [Bipolaris oryzae ATCC 44560]|uniref:Uncharacterized protein n=1 Tax=Bipolaris oryzae ATCC 44560 TaxID=930090 RepID=W6ZT01_COCMI|nr:uncharacterized protein COCMIDRAFT_91714 [Bipolaris oryzae ATCC 44560]EUC46821.1 hypothetical protein COCMIDRAFT_91714 [Bipolaris oryzae ATCC 44560]
MFLISHPLLHLYDVALHDYFSIEKRNPHEAIQTKVASSIAHQWRNLVALL